MGRDSGPQADSEEKHGFVPLNEVPVTDVSAGGAAAASGAAATTLGIWEQLQFNCQSITGEVRPTSANDDDAQVTVTEFNNKADFDRWQGQKCIEWIASKKVVPDSNFTTAVIHSEDSEETIRRNLHLRVFNQEVFGALLPAGYMEGRNPQFHIAMQITNDNTVQFRISGCFEKTPAHGISTSTQQKSYVHRYAAFTIANVSSANAGSLNITDNSNDATQMLLTELEARMARYGERDPNDHSEDRNKRKMYRPTKYKKVRDARNMVMEHGIDSSEAKDALKAMRKAINKTVIWPRPGSFGLEGTKGMENFSPAVQEIISKCAPEQTQTKKRRL